ncbi:ribitol-5-phosphate transferase FKTN-like [Haliotis asinina]|uniref:ribitol-5-phosphate transferase FKTN-like n=1 Tax=Haliotis asinina TaxID=109174 RepID=UPI003532603B
MVQGNMRIPTRDCRSSKRTLQMICSCLVIAAVCAVLRHFTLRKENLVNLVRTFTSTCLHRDITIFVIEPVVLRSLLADSKPHCVLCSAGNVITLGVLDADWDKRGSLLQDLSYHGFFLQVMASPDPRLLSSRRLNVPSIPTHYRIHQGLRFRSFIHLVVFYKRADNFLWHSALEPSKTTGLNLSFGRHAGAYDRFNLQGMTVDGIRLHVPHTVEQFLVQVSQSEFTECDYKRAQRYLEQHPKFNTTITQYGPRVLLKAKSVLDSIGVTFSLSSGTCLGWYRQCDFIAHSPDIDIEVPIQEFHTSMIPAFLKAGFELLFVAGKVSDSFTIAIFAFGVKIDVYFVYEERTHLWYGGTEKATGRKFKYILPKSKLCWTYFMGVRVRVPCPALPYILTNYGPKWNTSIKRWDWRASGSNAKANGMWSKEDRDSFIYNI